MSQVVEVKVLDSGPPAASTESDRHPVRRDAGRACRLPPSRREGRERSTAIAESFRGRMRPALFFVWGA